MARPTNQSWDCDEAGSADHAARYLRYLDIYKRVLEEEEAKMIGGESKELSQLVHWSERTGAMWVHMLLTTGFNHPHSFPFIKLVSHVGIHAWESREQNISMDEAETFGVEKERQLIQYEHDLRQLERIILGGA